MSSNPPSDSTPSQPPMHQEVLRQKLSMLAWLRVGFGALAGLLAGVLNFLTLDAANGNPNAYYGLYVAVLVYLGSFYYAKYSFLKGIPDKDKNKLITQGIGSFIMMFLFVWILYNTACYLFGCFHI